MRCLIGNSEQCYNARQRLVQRNEPQHPPRRTPAGRPGKVCYFVFYYIFSAKKYGILQIFVYLCTLELMPLLAAAKALVLFV